MKLFTHVLNRTFVTTVLAAVASLCLLTGTAQANAIHSSAKTNPNINASLSEEKINSLTLNALEQQDNTERSGGSHYGSVKGYIGTVMTGSDSNFGMRFWLDLEEDNTDQMKQPCDPIFVYTTTTEHSGLTGHANKVTLFMSAYAMKQKVKMTVQYGRHGYCELVEGYVYQN